MFEDRNDDWGPQLAFVGESMAHTGYFHSKLEYDPWIEIQIVPMELTSITIINRKDSCGERLENVEVRAGMERGLNKEIVGFFDGPGSTGGRHLIPFQQPTMTEYIVLKMLQRQYLQINGIKLNEEVLWSPE